MRFDRQLVAVEGNGFGLFSTLLRRFDLPPIASVVTTGAP
jgi:hypothetical protein